MSIAAYFGASRRVGCGWKPFVDFLGNRADGSHERVDVRCDNLAPSAAAGTVRTRGHN